MRNRRARILLALTIPLSSAVIIHPASAVPILAPIDMGAAAQFSLLAPTISIGGAITVFSAIGALSKASATGEASITDPTIAKHFGNDTYTAAIGDLSSAISQAFSDTSTAKPRTELAAQTFVPGRYYFPIQEVTPPANSVITLDASSNPNGVYIFLFPGNFTPGATVHVMGNADPEKVFWIVNGNFTLGGASSIWEGNVLASGNITIGNTDILIGRALSSTSVTTDADQILSGRFNPNFSVNPSAETGTVGVAMTPIRMTNIFPDLVSYTINPGLPSGILFNSSTGEIYGTPLESQTVTSYVITASRGTTSATQHLMLTINANAAKSLLFTDTTLKDVTIGDFYSDTITAEARTGDKINNDPITY